MTNNVFAFLQGLILIRHLNKMAVIPEPAQEGLCKKGAGVRFPAINSESISSLVGCSYIPTIEALFE